MPALLEVENLQKSFGKKPLFTDLSLSIDPGANLLLIGPSGSGKSTLLKLIAGLDAPTKGTIRLDGRVASQDARITIPAHKRGVAMVFQDLGLWPNLTIDENVALGLAGTRLSRREKADRANAMLELCELSAKKNERPARLSAGEQQRVALARAMAARPNLLLLDEPFTGLDLVLKNSLAKYISQLAPQFGASLLLVSHNPLDASAFSASVAVLEDGQICETGPFEQLTPNPKSRTVRAWARQIAAST
jgi:iron(III) transport system ATP-binding protein